MISSFLFFIKTHHETVLLSNFQIKTVIYQEFDDSRYDTFYIIFLSFTESMIYSLHENIIMKFAGLVNF